MPDPAPTPHAPDELARLGCVTNTTSNFPPITMESLEEMKRRLDELPRIERRELTREEMVFVEIGIGLGLIEVRKAKWPDDAFAMLTGFTCPAHLMPALEGK